MKATKNFMMPVLTDIFFYDTWFYWASAQLLANLILVICLVKECSCKRGKNSWCYIGAMIPLIAFGTDIAMICMGILKGGIISKYVFSVMFAVTMVVVLRIIPREINAAEKKLEQLSEEMAACPGDDYTRLNELYSQQEVLEERLLELYEQQEALEGEGQ